MGIFMILSGPLLGAWITPDVGEQGAIWCFFSVLLVAVPAITGLIMISLNHYQHTLVEKKQKRIFKVHSTGYFVINIGIL